MFRGAFSNPFANPFPSSGAAAAALVYLLRDEFTTDEAAPIASPRTCEPGPGTLTIVDTGNKLSIASGRLTRTTGALDNWENPRIYATSGIPRASGLLFSATVRADTTFNDLIGFRSAVTGGSANVPLAYYPPLVWNSSVGFFLIPDAVIANTNYIARMIARSSGGFVVVDNTLLWIFTEGNQTPLYPSWQFATTTLGVYSDDWIVCQLASPWDTDYGIATNRVAIAAVNETVTSEANAFIEMTWTAVTGETWELSTRRTDDSNRWIVRCSQSGSTVKLIQCQAGIETERSSAAQTWTNGTSYRLVIRQVGNSISTYINNVPKNSYTSATFNNTATGIKTNRAGSNLVAWPRTLSGAALAELEKWTS